MGAAAPRCGSGDDMGCTGYGQASRGEEEARAQARQAITSEFKRFRQDLHIDILYMVCVRSLGVGDL
jgi:hypothetical protein